MQVVGACISVTWEGVAEEGKDFERLQKLSFERVLDRHVATDEMVGVVESVVAFVVNVVLPAEIVVAVNEKAGVEEHLRRTLVADEDR